ncbi:glucose-6-phosphate isomerase [Salinisphaera sp. P385]|uniref:Glucose-6-phosphate isomerase n=1 Tax=Spectribacter acetivorans TaxID=3075603 RepID=A0ABU3B5K1_9GAMM|nr:glucose-6-phosphate isomerase [Salinisphaera sp. P385]MDT0617734.1 glucose-6-phosphate isomerase [Salinisphaera sp. P385]
MAHPIDRPAWASLEAARDRLAGTHLSTLFERDARRADSLCLAVDGLVYDFSRQRLDAGVMTALTALAGECGVPDAIRAMFAGEPVNRSEQRAAWHVALRAPAGQGYPADVHAVLDDIDRFVGQVRDGSWPGFAGHAITDVVNIGIGGSDLGPRMVAQALPPAPGDLRVHFAANVDPADLDGILAALDPATTLFVVTSKSFGTAETLANARAARDWLLAAAPDETAVARHFVAVSTNIPAAQAFGIERVFGFWDWVGGRFSLWSAAGLSVALARGMPVFRELLAGAHDMDTHFRQAPLAVNLPVVMALIGVWNRNLLNLTGQVVVPYAHRLGLFPAWLQQLEMESNGKSVKSDGTTTTVATVPQVWGGGGTNAQHAFFQMLHQGTDVLPVDFILVTPTADDDRSRQLAANCLAQAAALMHGRPEAETLAGSNGDPVLAAQRSFPGNRPSSTLLLDRLDARRLGALIAAHEHKVFVQGVIWGINSFDQWGVELGKTLADDILAAWSNDDSRHLDATTRSLLDRLRRR